VFFLCLSEPQTYPKKRKMFDDELILQVGILISFFENMLCHMSLIAALHNISSGKHINEALVLFMKKFQEHSTGRPFQFSRAFYSDGCEYIFQVVKYSRIADIERKEGIRFLRIRPESTYVELTNGLMVYSILIDGRRYRQRNKKKKIILSRSI